MGELDLEENEFARLDPLVDWFDYLHLGVMNESWGYLDGGLHVEGVEFVELLPECLDGGEYLRALVEVVLNEIVLVEVSGSLEVSPG